MSILQEVHLTNFSAFHQLDWTGLGQLNVVIGVNDTGKTQLLKAMYGVCRAYEEYIGAEGTIPKDLRQKSLPNYIEDKFYSLFFPKEKSPIVRRSETVSKISINMLGLNPFFSFYLYENGIIGKPPCMAEQLPPLDQKFDIESLFLPTKEIFSMLGAIFETRGLPKKLDSFDDTYFDLYKDFQSEEALDLPASVKYLEPLDNITGGGRIQFLDGQLWFVRDGQRYGIHQVAEGIRKISIFDRLIRNHRLKLNKDNPTSVLFLDEPETSLHPEAIIIFAEVLHSLAQNGVQVFLTTHSYFLLKRLEQLAKRDKTDYTLLNLQREDNRILSSQTLLRSGLPENPIIDQSMRLYYEDVGLKFGSESK